MVLADDNFASITAAVKEGRTVYNNIEKAILFMCRPTSLRRWSISGRDLRRHSPRRSPPPRFSGSIW